MQSELTILSFSLSSSFRRVPDLLALSSSYFFFFLRFPQDESDPLRPPSTLQVRAILHQPRDRPSTSYRRETGSTRQGGRRSYDASQGQQGLVTTARLVYFLLGSTFSFLDTIPLFCSWSFSSRRVVRSLSFRALLLGSSPEFDPLRVLRT